MGLTLVTPPVAEPVTLDEAKAHLRVQSADEDTYISALIVAATRHIEKVIGKSLMARTYRLTLDTFSDAIELLRGPVTSVTSVQYVDENGDTQTVAAGDYTVDLVSNRQWLVRNADASWPSLLDAVNVVSIDYVAGYEVLPDEYEDLKFAILLLLGHWFVNREAVNISTATASEVPLAVDALVQPYRWILV